MYFKNNKIKKIELGGGPRGRFYTARGDCHHRCGRDSRDYSGCFHEFESGEERHP